MRSLARALPTFAVGAILFWIAFDGGSYALDSRSTLGIAVWWTILVAVGLGVWPLVRPPRAALVAGAFLAALTALTALSIAWAESAERAFTEANRAALYLGVFLLAVLAGTRGNVTAWSDGVAIGVAVVDHRRGHCPDRVAKGPRGGEVVLGHAREVGVGERQRQAVAGVAQPCGQVFPGSQAVQRAATYRVGGVAELDRQRLAQQRGAAVDECGDVHVSNDSRGLIS